MFSFGKKRVAQSRQPGTNRHKLYAAIQGYPRAQTILGVMYEDGEGVSQDYAEAIKWYRLDADKGFARGQANLGSMYNAGLGVPQDIAKAMSLCFSVSCLGAVTPMA